MVGAGVAAGVYSYLTAPNLADGTLREPDEMDRSRTGGGLPGFDEVRGALNRTSGGISLSDLPYWNQVSANRYKAAHPTKTIHTTPTDTPTPPTQPGNDGAPPNVPRSPVASPGHPEDNGCGCYTFFRGTGYWDMLETIQNQAIDIERLAAHQDATYASVLEKGVVYLTKQAGLARYFASLADQFGRAGGMGILQIDVPTDAFDAFVAKYGITVEGAMPDPPSAFPNATETRIRFEFMDEFNQFAKYSEYNPEGEGRC